MKLFKYIAAVTFTAALFFSCQEKSSKTIIEELSLTTQNNSSEPSLLKTEKNEVFLSWVETDSLNHSKLLFAQLSENKWIQPRLIAEGNNWFVNWADFPSLMSFGDNTLAAHFLEKSASGTYTYDVKLTLIQDNGVQWST